MSLREYLSDRLGQLVLRLFLVAVSVFFLYATGTQAGVLVLLVLFWGAFSVISLAVGFVKTRSHLAELASIMEGLDQKYLFTECIPKPRHSYERIIYLLMRRAGKAMIEEVSNARAAQKEYREYIESWVHEVKAPITAAQLACRNAASASGSLTSRLSGELARIENHVERVLFYARAESPEKDFLIRPVDLEEVVNEAIGQHQTLLIQSGMRIETEGLSQLVYTDEKWLCFILGQLLQNAVRYRTEQPLLILSAGQAEKQVMLRVQDNGIGIPSHELSRVCERGFTGSNGRSRGGSTGMGLYLGRRLADFLEIDLHIQSEEGKGTCITLTLPAAKR